MTPPPLVSIVTPSFNQAAFLAETIGSVLSQDYPRIEYIIIDGGSTDASVEIIQRFSGQLAFWVSEPDEGQADAINKGWRRANGDIVAYLNSDDTYEPGAIRTAVEYLTSHPETAMVCGDCYQLDEDGKRVGLMRARAVSLQSLLLHNTIMQPTTFIQRDVLRETGLLDPTLGHSMDYDLWLRVALGHRIDAIPVPLANFRAHRDSKSFANPQVFLRDRQKIFARFFSQPTLKPELAAMEHQAMVNSYLSTIFACFALGQKDIGVELWKEMAFRYPDYMAQPESVIDLVANTAVHKVETPWLKGQSQDPQVWLVTVLAELPPSADPLRQLAPRISSRIHSIRAFEAYWQNDYAVTRGEIPRAWRDDPRTLLNRGLASIWLQSVMGAGKMQRWKQLRNGTRVRTMP